MQKALASSGSVPVGGQDNATQARTAGKQHHASEKQKAVSDVNAEQPDANVNNAQLPAASQKQSGLVQHEAKESKRTLPPSKSAETVLPSGDDLGDEFAIEVEAQEDSGAKQRKKAVHSPDSAMEKADTSKPKIRKSKHKVVQF